MPPRRRVHERGRAVRLNTQISAASALHQPRHDGPGGTAGSQDEAAGALWSSPPSALERHQEPIDIRVVAAQDAVLVDDGVDRPDSAGCGVDSVKEGEDGLFVRHRDVRPDDPQRPEPTDSCRESLGGDIEGHVTHVDALRLECGVVHQWGPRVAHRVAYETGEPRSGGHVASASDRSSSLRSRTTDRTLPGDTCDGSTPLVGPHETVR